MAWRYRGWNVVQPNEYCVYGSGSEPDSLPGTRRSYELRFNKVPTGHDVMEHEAA
jgi:hypothetical protein